MKYTGKIVHEASKEFLSKLESSPNLVRNRMNSEPELYHTLTQFAQMMTVDYSDSSIKETVLGALLYGFMIREEIAVQTRATNPENEA